MELLTREEYGTLAADMEFATQAFVAGGYRPATSGKIFASINPATGAD
jgi:gamma-glutamyl-gamma-aminobutyraldehyde dehydrogenase